VGWGLPGVAVRNLPQHPVPGAAALLAGTAVAAAALAGISRPRKIRTKKEHAKKGTAAACTGQLTTEGS
jgi:hypothetical protein